jgi:hypothetical protein
MRYEVHIRVLGGPWRILQKFRTKTGARKLMSHLATGEYFYEDTPATQNQTRARIYDSKKGRTLY